MEMDKTAEDNIYRIFRRIEENYPILVKLVNEHGTPEQRFAFKEAVYGTSMALSCMLSGYPMNRCRKEESERMAKINMPNAELSGVAKRSPLE